MYSTIKGVFKKGGIELLEPVEAEEGEVVLITFLEHEQPEKRGSLKGLWGHANLDEEIIRQAKHSVFSYNK